MTTTKWMALSCSHFPLQDEEAWNDTLAVVEDHKPDVVVHLGDIFEAQAASRWSKIYDWTLRYEFEVAQNHMKELRTLAQKVNPGCRMVWLPGNHDDNLVALDRIPGDIRGMCNPFDHLDELKEGHWEVPTMYVHDRDRGVFRLGQCAFAHGYEHSVNSDESQALKFADPYGLFVSGHTHRPRVVTQCKKTMRIKLPYWYANPGCTRTLSPIYVQRQDHSQWGHGVVIGDCDSWRYDSSLIPRKPLWNAETIIFRTAVGYAPEQPDWRAPYSSREGVSLSS